jgi:hypothetical protein
MHEPRAILGFVRLTLALLLLGLMAGPIVDAQSKKAPTRKAPPAKKAPPPAPTRLQVALQCPSELGVGVKTHRRFCDVLTGREPKDGITFAIPPHRGPVVLSFELHNRHTYSEELVKAKTAYRKYTATIGVLTMDNTLVERAVIQSEFRSAADLFDRVAGGAGPGGVKAVAPTGDEFITMELPEDVGDQVSVLGEKLLMLRADGSAETFSAPGRPIATISNVMIEYVPAAPAKQPPAKKP